MSDKEKKSGNDEEKILINQDEGSKNPKIKTEGNVSLDSNRNTETISENVPRLAVEGSGDGKEHNPLEHLKLDKIKVELTETSKEFIDATADEGSGDYKSKTKVTEIDDNGIEYANTEIDAKISKTNVNAVKDKSNDTFLNQCDEIESISSDDLDEIEEEEMELTLRWDEDDASNQAKVVDNGKAYARIDDILSEDQLLEEPSDVLTKVMTEMPSDGNPKDSEANLDSNVLKVNSDETRLTRDNNSKVIETIKESEICSKLDTPSDKSEDEKILVNELSEENNLNTEAINSPEMDFSAEEGMDRDDINRFTEAINSPEMDFSMEEIRDRDNINVLEEKLMEESEIITEAEVIAQAKKIFEQKNIDEPIKDTESAKNNLLKEVTASEQTKEDPVIEEDQVLAESESNTKTNSSTLKLQSLTDVVLNKDIDDYMTEESLLEEPDSKGDSSLIIFEKGIECSEIVPEKEVPVNKENNDDVLLEEKLLYETETADVTPESDITMDVEDGEEAELLKYDECQEDSSTSMDVDDTDTSIGGQTNIEDKILDQTMNQSEVAKKDIALPIVDQTYIEKVDEIKVLDESDDQSKTIGKVIDQPDKTVGIIQDTPNENEANIDEKIVDQAMSEKETIDQQIDDQIKMEDSKKDQLILESNIKEQSTENPVQIDGLTVTDPVNVLVEDLKEPAPEKTTLEKEIENKTGPEKCTENTEHIISTDLDKPEKCKETINPDTSLDKNEETDEISHNNSSIFLEYSCPIKTDHGLHKPDVMLEIPTQELIDMDDTDFSMNLDNSEEILNGVDKNVDDDIVHEKTTDETMIDDVIVSDKVVTDTVSEKSVAKTKVDDDTIKEKPIDQKALVTETTAVDKIIAGDDTVKEKPVDQKASVTETTAVDKIIADDDTVKEKPVDQKALVPETTAVDKIIANDDTVKEKSVDQEAVVTESTIIEAQTESDIEASYEKVEDTVVQSTVEENMAIMFADDEGKVIKEIAECIASTSQVQVPTEHPTTSVTRMTPDTLDEVPEIDDSLGLLAESAGRMMEDDEEPDDDFDDDDIDESSNQISAEQSEDSNQAAAESEPVRDQEDKDLDTPDPNDEEFPFSMCDSTSEDKAEKMDVEEYGTVELQAETINEMNEETKSAVDALLNADNPANEQAEEQQDTTDQMDIETVKLSDTSDNEIDVEPTKVQPAVAESSKESEEKQKSSPSKSPNESIISPKQSPSNLRQSPCKLSPSKMKNLAISTQESSSVVNIVDLEESSSEDDIQEREPETTEDVKSPSPGSDVTNVNIPTGIDIMCTSGGNMSEIMTKDNLSQVVISGVPKPPPHKPARLNTSEVTIKTVSNTEPLIIPEAKINEQTQTQSTPKLSLEIFSLDSDDDENAAKAKSPPISPEKMPALELEKARETSKCINYCCTSDNKVPYKLAEASEVAYYDAGRKRRSMVCQPCADVVAARTKSQIQGIIDLTPLLDLDMGKLSQDLVQISDSESEDEEMSPEEPKESIGEKGAIFIEENLAKYLNDTWKKYDMDTRLTETQLMLDDEIEKLENDSKEIDAMLNECQVATDKLRCELYATFECRRHQQPSLVIFDTPESKFIGLEEQVTPPAAAESIETRQAKRRLSSTSETPAKRPAIPLGYAPLDASDAKEKAAIPGPDTKLDDDKDISVVKLSVEAAPADLPPPGEISRPPLRTGMPVYAMKNAFGPWLKGRVVEIQSKNTSGGNPFSLCLVKFDHKAKANGKVLLARCIAYSEPADVRMLIGTRLIALFKDSNKRESYYSGVVAETPNPVNNYRYLVFFDDGYAQYVQHQFTRLVCESSPLVWEEVHPFSREFVREYLQAYPERPMVRLHEGQHLKTEWNGKWWSSRVTRVDASLAQVMFVGDGRREWIYRGSTRLAPLYLELRAAERHRPRPMPRSKAQPRFNMPYVEYTRSDEQESTKPVDAQNQQQQQQQQQIQNEEIRRQRAVAKKSTSAPPQVLPPTQQVSPPNHMDPVTSRVVYYTPKNAVKPLKMVPHRCGPRCKRSDVLSLKELRTYNPLAKPLLSGWERQIVRFKGHKEVMYRAPCGRRIRNMRELHHYLRSIDSDLPVDLFDFHYSTHCLAEFVLNKCLVGKKDLSHGKENVPVPCVNYYDDSLPEFCSYNTERTPTAGVPLNIEPEFLCGCDCTDDCQDKSKCACWKMTLEGARTIGLRGPNLGYVYKRLPEPLPSGIYECNSRCKCKNTCLNRVAQHPLQLKLQVFKTPNRGWGIRALNDVPKGSFLCVYAGNLLTDATANLDGLNEGDEYLAELDYIEVVEQMKEGYEEDIPEADKKLDKKDAKDGDDNDEDEESSSEEEEKADKNDKQDDDFRPGYIGVDVTAEYNKRLRKRAKSKKEKEKSATDEKEKEKDTTKESNAEEDCITISDDEEVREPSRFMAQTNMGANEYISKYKSVRTLFGKDEACYIMDAKVQGNIGRYLNHSCCPNVFVQNVFVDTHDPRFPWVAFFALSHIKAGTELTWNYNYDVGSVPGKILYCYCGAPNCRGRLL